MSSGTLKAVSYIMQHKLTVTDCFVCVGLHRLKVNDYKRAKLILHSYNSTSSLNTLEQDG